MIEQDSFDLCSDTSAAEANPDYPGIRIVKALEGQFCFHTGVKDESDGTIELFTSPRSALSELSTKKGGGEKAKMVEVKEGESYTNRNGENVIHGKTDGWPH